MLSGTYQSMVMSLMAGSMAFFRDLISWGGVWRQCQTWKYPQCPPVPLPGCYLGLQPLGRTQELGTAPAHLGHGLQQLPAHPWAHAKAEAPAGKPGDGKPWLGGGWELENPVV